MEVWKDIEGFEGLYKISDHGRVWSNYSNKVLKPSLTGPGYPFVNLYRGDYKVQAKIHRLVAETFIGRTENLWVNHKNGVKTDNHASNLEWVTPSENNVHSYRQLGRSSGNASLSDDQVMKIDELLMGGVKSIDIAKALNISARVVGGVKRGDSYARITGRRRAA